MRTSFLGPCWVLAALTVVNGLELLKERPPRPLDQQLKPDQLPKLQWIVDTQNCHPKDVDLYFVVDNSGSIGHDDFESIKKFIENVVNLLDLIGATRSQVGIVTFNSDSKVYFPLNRYPNVPAIVLDSVIERMPNSFGQTDIAGGMMTAINSGFTSANGDRATAPNLMVVITDGHDNTDVQAAHQEAADKDIKTLAIGIGDDVNYEELLQIAGGDSKLVFDVSSFQNLSQIVETVCEDFSPCDGNPCLHGGTCLPQSDGQNYTCKCPPRWHGPLCEKPSSPCASNPCENGGTCTDQGSDFQCTCPPGFTGKDCHEPFCQNGGSFKCTCDFGWEGVECREPVNFCNQTQVLHNGTVVDLHICGEHGECISTNIGVYCDCHPGWTGLYCEHDIDDCLDDPCQNGGTCDNQLGVGYKCHCPPLFTGPNCETIPDFCDDLQILGKNGEVEDVSICGEHGECMNGAEGVHCVCDPAYTGKFCDVEIQFNCTYTDSKGKSQSYPHDSYWIDDCNQCICKYGNVTCAKSVECAAPDPTCDFPVGWCFPVGHIMIDTLTIPTNPPNGWHYGSA